MKHLTVISICFSAMAVLIAILALTETAFADDAWDAECAGTLVTYQQQPECISGTDFKTQGVVDYNGRIETWYSSQTLYHYRTPEWTADSDGFYRTDEGYFVVASDAYEQGAVIETSRGLAQVLDSGCGENIDFYVSW